MFGLRTHSFLLQKMRPRIILRLHLAIEAILIFIYLILEKLLVFFQLVIENNIVFELVFVVCKERMLNNVRKGHPLLAIYHEYSLEKIL
jgi:hypothetical protein